MKFLLCLSAQEDSHDQCSLSPFYRIAERQNIYAFLFTDYCSVLPDARIERHRRDTVDTRMQLSPGVFVQATVLAVLHGRSPLHRIKQFVEQQHRELLCVDRGVPIFGSTLDGNSPDKHSNNAMLSRISTLMSLHGLGEGACIYVADSAMVTKENLECLGQM